MNPVQELKKNAKRAVTSTLTNTTHAGPKMRATASTIKISGIISATSSMVIVKISNDMTTKATSLEGEPNEFVKIFIKMNNLRSIAVTG